MNRARQKRLSKAKELIDEGIELIRDVAEEEQDAFDNLSEERQEGERGQAVQGTISILEKAVALVEEAESHLRG